MTPGCWCQTVAGKRLGVGTQAGDLYQRDMKDGLTVEEKLPKMPAGVLVRLIVIDDDSRRMGERDGREQGVGSRKSIIAPLGLLVGGGFGEVDAIGAGQDGLLEGQCVWPRRGQ